MLLLEFQKLARLLSVFAVASLASGCFRPLYADSTTVGGYSVVDKMRSVEVDTVKALIGGRLPRVAGEVRNGLIFALTGGGTSNTPDYRLTVSISSQNVPVIADVISGRPDGQIYGIDAFFVLTEVGTGKAVLNGTTFARVSYNLPGQQQRFAGDRSLRDAENRTSQVIADQIRSRLASYFTAGT